MIWSVVLMKEHWLRAFENRMLMKMFGAKEEVTGKRWRLGSEGLHDFYSSQNIFWVIKSRRMRWVVHMACMGENRNAYSLLVGKLEGRRLLGRSMHRWEDKIKMDFKELGWGGMGSSGSGQG
jgi:hypothetical protein